MVDLDAQALRNRRVRCLFANLAEVESFGFMRTVGSRM